MHRLKFFSFIFFFASLPSFANLLPTPSEHEANTHFILQSLFAGRELSQEVNKLRNSLGSLISVVERPMADLTKHSSAIHTHTREALDKFTVLAFLNYKKVLISSAAARSRSAIARVSIQLIRSGEDISPYRPTMDRIKSLLEGFAEDWSTNNQVHQWIGLYFQGKVFDQGLDHFNKTLGPLANTIADDLSSLNAEISHIISLVALGISKAGELSSEEIELKSGELRKSLQKADKSWDSLKANLPTGELSSEAKQEFKELEQNFKNLLSLLIARGNFFHSHTTNILTFFDSENFTLVSPLETQKNPLLRAVGNLMLVIGNPVYPEEEGDEIIIEPYCTGIQISPKHVLTAAHCDMKNLIFNKARIARPEDAFSYKVSQFGTSLRYHFEGDYIDEAKVVENSQIPMEVAIFKDKELDYAILELAEPMSGPFLDLSSLNISHHQNLNMYHQLEVYSFPHGMPLSLSSSCKGIKASHLLYHDCDTLTGSSGGLVVDKENGRTPLAIHLSGPAINSWIYYLSNGSFETSLELAKREGCYQDKNDFHNCLLKKGFNKAILLSSILASLKENAPGPLEKILTLSKLNKHFYATRL